MPDAQGPIHGVRTEFLRALFFFAPDNHYVEFRCLNGKPRETKVIHIPIAHLRTKDLPHDWIDLLNEQGYNIYFSACPRTSRMGTGAGDVKFALAVWADFDNGYPDPWPETLPKPSVVYSSSEGRFQGWWLLDRPCGDLDRIERINRSLALALGADPKVFDRARILRLPETRNVKPDHPDKPMARMWYEGYQERHNLDTLEALLPAAPITPTRTQRQGARGGKFDPHAGTPLPQDLQQDLTARLLTIGLTITHDGRLSGPCPFEGHNPGSKDANFLISPVTGQWWCFGTNHPGAGNGKLSVSGGVNTLLPRIGMATPEQTEWLPPIETLADEEPQQAKEVMSSYDRTRVYPQVGTTTLVPPRQDIMQSSAPQHDIMRPSSVSVDIEEEPADLNGALEGGDAVPVIEISAQEQRRREVLIKEEFELALPLPHGLPKLKRVSKVRVVNGREEGKTECLFSNTWQNPVNAMGHRRCAYKHFRLRTWDWPEMYYHEVAADDWDEKRRASLERRVKHRGGLWFAMNNLATRHMVAVFTSVLIDGAELIVGDRVQAEIATSIADIEPPERMEKRQRFKPYWCSRALAVKRPKGTGEWEVVGRQEVECAVEEFVPIVERAAAKNGFLIEWRTSTRRPEVYGPQMYFRATEEARKRALAEHPDGEHHLHLRFIRDCGDGLTKKAWEDLTGQKQEDRFPKRKGRRGVGSPA